MTYPHRLGLSDPTYFFTVRLERKGDTLLTDHIDSLRYAYAKAVQEYPVTCHAMVVLPDHLHAVWTEPEGGIWYAQRWRRLKTLFAGAISERIGLPGAEAKRGKGVWQRGFAEHALLSETDLRLAMDYVCLNPQRHGLVADAALWPYSSFAKVRRVALDFPRAAA